MNAFQLRGSSTALALATGLFVLACQWLAISPVFAAGGMTGTVYTADENAGSVSMIDLASGKVTTTKIPVVPHNVQVARGGNIVLAAGMAAAEHSMGSGTMHGATHGAAPAGQLVVLDSRDLAKPSEPIAVGGHPGHVIADPEGKFAYVTDADANAVTVVDLTERKAVGAIKTGAYPHGLRMSPDGREIYVANVKDGSVSVVDVAARREVARIKVGKAPVQVGFSPDGKFVYASVRDENSVAVIDTAKRVRIAMVKVGSQPIQVYATPDGKLVYVANQGTAKKPANTVSVIETAGNSVVATLTVGRGAHSIVVSDDGSRAFVSNLYDNTVSAIDTATQRVVATFKVGAGPNGISYRAAN